MEYETKGRAKSYDIDMKLEGPVSPACEMLEYQLPYLKQAAANYAFIISNGASVWTTRELKREGKLMLRGKITSWTVQIFVDGKCIQPTKPTLPEAIQAARDELSSCTPR